MADDGLSCSTARCRAEWQAIKGIERDAVTGVLEEWLATLSLDGPDGLRAELALKLAAELDDPASPRHAG